MSTQTFSVSGMTCQHCVASVTEEVSEVSGADRVVVDLEAGTLVVEGDAAADDIRAAVAEAGYEVA